MDNKYIIKEEFVSNLLGFIMNKRVKILKVNRFNFLDLRDRSYTNNDMKFDLERNVITIKTNNKIRNPKDFTKFISVFIETALEIDSSLAPNTVSIKELHSYSGYIEQGNTKLSEEFLKTQSLINLTTQGDYDLDSLETESIKTFIVLTTQNLQVLKTQNLEPIIFPSYDYNSSSVLETQQNMPINIKFYNKNKQLPLLSKGFKLESYIRIYKA
jgi:hypothetical protein